MKNQGGLYERHQAPAGNTIHVVAMEEILQYVICTLRQNTWLFYLTLGQTVFTKHNLTQTAIIWGTPSFKGVASHKA
jgi:hypothetical protein